VPSAIVLVPVCFVNALAGAAQTPSSATISRRRFTTGALYPPP
jgi:hypothetical protein